MQTERGNRHGGSRWTLAGVLVAVAAMAAPATAGQPASTGTPTGNQASAHPIVTVLTGKVRLFGIEEDATLVFDDAGRVAWSIDGRVHLGQGFNGSRAWSEDFGTPATTLSFREREELVILGALLGGVMSKEGGPLELQTPRDGVTPFAVRNGSTRGTLALDDDGRIATAIWGEGAARQTTKLSEWKRAENGQWFPGRLERESRGEGILSFQLASATAPKQTQSFTPAEPGRSGASFDAAKPAVLEVRKAKTGHLLVQPVINGKQCGCFIFDTGAGATVLDTKVAKQIGLETFGEIPVGGVGGYVTSPLATPDTLTVGPATINKPMVITLDLEPIANAMGETIAGVLGYDLLSRVVTEIDLEGSTIALHDPSRYATQREWQPLQVFDRHPCLGAEFEGHTGVFMLDTGSNLPVSVHAPAVEASKLLADGRETKEIRIGGSGGFRAVRLGKLASFKLGGKEFKDVGATFSQRDETGALAETSLTGTIGGPLLKKFLLVLDYTRERVALVEREAGTR